MNTNRIVGLALCALALFAMPMLLTALLGWCASHIAAGIQRGFNGQTLTTERN